MSKFMFDKRTGTMIPEGGMNVQNELKQQVGSESEIRQMDAQNLKKPVFAESKTIEAKSDVVNAQDRIVKMKRVSKPTPVQLINESGIPESYLDATNTGIMMFRETQDYDICQIVDERTGKPLAYIGGYALQFNFNMAELNTMERIEQCLQGLVKLFRHKIMTQQIGSGGGES